MALTLGLYKGYTTGGSQVSDLLSTADLILRAGGWTARTADYGENITWDVFDLVSRDTTAAGLLENYYTVQKFISDARMYHESKSPDPCWIRAEPTGGYVQHSLVYDGVVEIPGESKWSPLLTSDGKGYMRLALAHSAAWERTTLTTVSATGISVNGGIWKPTITHGDLDGRITEFKATAQTTASAYQSDYWIGMRRWPDTNASFVSFWEAENYRVLGTDSATAADANASGGYRVTVSFATNSDVIQRVMIGPYSVAGATTYGDFAGDYLVLGRLGCSGIGSTFQLNLYNAYYSSIMGQAVSEVTFTPAVTGYQYVELGRVAIPPNKFKNYADLTAMCGDTVISLYAGRTAGSNNLYIDAFVLIPADMLITAKNAAGVGQELVLSSEPTGIVWGRRETPTGDQFGNIEYGNGTGLIVPRNGNVVVAVAQFADPSSSLVSTTDLTLTYTPRYSLYRDT